MDAAANLRNNTAMALMCKAKRQGDGGSGEEETVAASTEYTGSPPPSGSLLAEEETGPAFQASFLLQDRVGDENDESLTIRSATTTTKESHVVASSSRTFSSSSSSSSSSAGNMSTMMSSWRKKVQEKLHQRGHEENLLQASFDRSRYASNHVILISGASGTGKTRLAKTLQQDSRVVGDGVGGGGYFLSGKFDQLQRAAPYTAYVNAFTNWTFQVQNRGPQELQRVQRAIEQAVGTETGVLTGMIPALEAVLSRPNGAGAGAGGTDQNGLANSNNGGALHRFMFVFASFIRAMCSPERPLVLLLDDLQFADMCSLDLFYHLASDQKNKGLVLLGTCDDTVQSDSYLASKLRDLEAFNKTKITNIQLRNLEQEEIGLLLEDTMQLDVRDNAMLSKLLFRRTGGNISFVIEFMIWLQDTGVVSMSDSLGGRWAVDEARLSEMTGTCCGACNFLLDIMDSLPKKHQEVLKVAACMGTVLNETLIGYALDFELVEDILEDLKKRGLLWKATSTSAYEFDHDGIQDAAYKLIPKEERELFHLEIGRRTWRKLITEEVDKYIFTILSQMYIGRNLIKRDQEQTAVAHLCLHAAKKAARASTFRVAGVYLDFALGLMDERRWRTDYELMLALHNASAEMEMCRANFDRMNEVLTETLRHARVLKDKHQAYMTQIYALSSQRQQHKAVEIGIEVLRGLGERMPRKVRLFNVMTEYHCVKKLLNGKSDEQILRMDKMVDESKLKVLLILNAMLLPAMMERPDLAPLVLLKTLKITLQHGLSVLASISFAAYSVFCLNVNLAEANRFARLGLILLERYKVVEYLPIVYAAVYGATFAWSRPLRESLAPLLEGNRIGVMTGNLEYAGICANQYCFNALDASVPLDEICLRWQGFNESLTTNKQATLHQMLSPCMQCIHEYMGCGTDPTSNRPTVTDLDEAYRLAVENNSMSEIFGVRFCRMVLNYLFEDYEAAYGDCLTWNDIKMVPPTLEQSSSTFFVGMVRIHMAQYKRDVGRNRRIVKACLRRFRRWALGGPQNFMGQAFLLEAELASLHGKKEESTFQKYICAIAMFKANSFLHFAGVANVRLARHLERSGQKAAARKYWEEARDYYAQWKAHALVNRVDEMLKRYPH